MPGVSNATDVVQRFWSTLYARDWDAIPSFFTDQSIYFDVPTGGLSAARGGDRIVARLRLGIEPLSEYRHVLRNMAEHDGVVFTEHQEDWHFRTGEVVELPFVSVHHLEADHIMLWKDYWDYSTLMNGAPQWWHDRLAEADLWWVSEVPPL